MFVIVDVLWIEVCYGIIIFLHNYEFGFFIYLKFTIKFFIFESYNKVFIFESYNKVFYYKCPNVVFYF